MKGLLLGFFLLSITQCIAQFSSLEWHEGLMVTSDGDTLRGKIKYDLEANIVQLASRNKVVAFSSYKVFYFEIFDEVYKNYREFYTIPYNIKSDYKTPIIFELLYEGELSLLSREKIVQETVSNSSQFIPGTRITQNKLNFDFFFLYKNGEMTYYTGTKNELFQIMAKKKDEVKEFIKKNRLRTDVIRDLVRITSFYNSI